MVDLALERFGSLDTIVCNAGTLGIGSVTELSQETWQNTLNSNVSALFYLSKCAIPQMEKNVSGVVLANASLAAFKAYPKHPAYCASKAAQVALVRQLASEYGPSIRANALCPGPVDTPMIWDSAKAFEEGEKAVEEARSHRLETTWTTEGHLGVGSLSDLQRILLDDRFSGDYRWRHFDQLKGSLS